MSTLTQYYRSNPPDRFLRKTEESPLSEVVWDTVPTAAPPNNMSFTYNEEDKGYNLISEEGRMFTLIIHQTSLSSSVIPKEN